MFEKVNPDHPDKIADRIAGALVDYAYTLVADPRIAVEVLLGHETCNIIVESSVVIPYTVVRDIVWRIAGDAVPPDDINYLQVEQDAHLAENQAEGFRCGDNGIFKGVPVTLEQKNLCSIVREIYEVYPSDGKYIIDDSRLIICQSNAQIFVLNEVFPDAIINPLGDWTGGPGVDAGSTNRKLGSDMGDSVTGGGLHGKDLSKADVSVNIHAFLKAQRTGQEVKLCCAIGDDVVDGLPYSEIVEEARAYIQSLGGFEKFAEWGLIR